MKKLIALMLSLTLVLACVGCNNNRQANDLLENELSETGYPSGEVQISQVMYNDIIYYYTASGFDNPLPDGYELVGEVNKVDNKQEPSVNWCGSRVDIGQKIYVSENAALIYLEYENGYAEFATIIDT